MKCSSHASLLDGNTVCGPTIEDIKDCDCIIVDANEFEVTCKSCLLVAELVRVMDHMVPE